MKRPERFWKRYEKEGKLYQVIHGHHVVKKAFEYILNRDHTSAVDKLAKEQILLGLEKEEL